uniref:Si:dkey-122a22.2 n=1 Tax=Astyanax mexicanus TaxID=7994 RepID=A0A3B1K564_ASTMX
GKNAVEESTTVKKKQQQVKGSCWDTVVLLGKILLLVIFVPPFLNYASLQREREELIPKDAQLIDIGLGQKISLVCKGQGQPVVILDAPTGMSSDVWYHVQESVSQTTKVCAYDRVGLGFSRRVMENETMGMEKVWRPSTTGRMVDDLHRLVKVAELATPFILVGSELGALNGRFYSHIHDAQVSDLVLISPIPEDAFEEETWQQYWYTHLVPSLQVMQLSAAAGVSRFLLILGLLQPTVTGSDVSAEVIQRQKYLLSDPAHQSSAVDEHFFLNESVSQVGECPLQFPLSLSLFLNTVYGVLTGDLCEGVMSLFACLLCSVWQVFAELQRKALERVYPQAHRIHVGGVDRRMIYKKPSSVSKHLLELVSKRQTKQQRQ